MTLGDIIKDSLIFDIASEVYKVEKPPKGLFDGQPLLIKFENGSKMLYYPCVHFSKKLEEKMKEDFDDENQ